MRLTKKFMREFREDNDLLRRMNCKLRTLEEYVAYRSGNAKKSVQPKKLLNLKATTYHRPSPQVPSGDGIGVSLTKKPEMQYTGDELVGIATMHKSNMVPVRKDSNDAIDIARMRR